MLLVIVDHRRARIAEYAHGELQEREGYNIYDLTGGIADRNMSKRAATRSGERSETATDAPDRARRDGATQLLRTVLHGVRRAASDALIIVGGPAAASGLLYQLLRRISGDRVTPDESLHLRMTAAELRAVAERVALRVSQELQLSTVNDVVAQANGGAHGVAGTTAVAAAAQLGQLQLLLMTPQFIADHEDEAETLITRALDTSCDIDLVGGAAADALNAAGSGDRSIHRIQRSDAARARRGPR